MHCKLIIRYSTESSSTPCRAEVTLGLPRPMGTELLYSTISLSSRYLFGERLGADWGEATDDGFRERSTMIKAESWDDVTAEVTQLTQRIMTTLNNAWEISNSIIEARPSDSICTIYISKASKAVLHD